MKQGRNIFKFVGRLAIIVAVSALLAINAVIFIPDSPEEEIREALAAISEASSSNAPLYSRRLFREAEAAYDSAMSAWKRENRRFIYFRDYSDVINFAKKAAEKGRLAATSSVSGSRNLRERIDTRIKETKQTDNQIERFFGRYPLREELRARLAKGRLLLREAEVAFKKSQLLAANRKITDAEYLLAEVLKSATEELKSYFGAYPTWKKWAETSIAESARNNSCLILVDKIARKCYLYINGIRKYEFEAELGKNWVGDKRRMGDKATPEGRYVITRKYQGRETQYHKSLAINYPNSDDIERFNSDIARGIIPKGTKIGNGIEIHGGGGRGADWTDGCVALSDRDMDILFPVVKTGTPVTIVGSLRKIEDIISVQNE